MTIKGRLEELGHCSTRRSEVDERTPYKKREELHGTNYRDKKITRCEMDNAENKITRCEMDNRENNIIM